MNLEQYDYQSDNSFLDYEFYSIGPKGKIKKVVTFERVQTSNFAYYNLGFGDWNEQAGTTDDFVVSDNKDAEKVLATVANLLIEFTDHYDDLPVYAVGSSPARTRRYQMGINKYWSSIEPLFHVLGLIEGAGFRPFEKGQNYIAFLVHRKKM